MINVQVPSLYEGISRLQKRSLLDYILLAIFFLVRGFHLYDPLVAILACLNYDWQLDAEGVFVKHWMPSSHLLQRTSPGQELTDQGMERDSQGLLSAST